MSKEVESKPLLATNKKGARYVPTQHGDAATRRQKKLEKFQKKREQRAIKSNGKPFKQSKIRITGLPTNTTSQICFFFSTIHSFICFILTTTSLLTTTHDITELFTPIGNVKRAFIITERGSTTCNGSAFAKFEDEATAKKALRLNGVKFRGSQISVQIAKAGSELEKSKKSNDKDVPKVEVKEEETSNKKRALPKDSEKADPVKKRPKLDEKKLDRIVEVSKITFKINEKSMYQDFRRLKLCKPVQIDKKDESSVRILFVSPEEAVAACEKLNGYKYRNVKLAACLLSTPKLQNSRLIVRNLAFKCTTDELTETFSKFGKVVEVTIPINPNTKKPGGFGFVQFTKQEDAKKAIDAMQAKQIHGRVVAVDFAVAASDYLKAKLKASGVADLNGADDESEGDEDEGDQVEEDEDDEDDEDDEGEAMEGDDEDELEEGDEDEEMADFDEEGDDEEDEDGDEEDEEEGIEGEDGEDEEGEEDEGDIGDVELDDEDEFNFNKYNEDQGLFIRNLSYETTKEDLEKFFSRFGALKYALIVMNKETNTSKGCAFIKFKTGSDGIKVLKRYQELNPPSTMLAVPGKGKDKKQKVFVPSGSTDGTFVIGGRHFSVHPAVDREDIKSDRKENKKLTKVDSRNTVLARLSIIKDTTGFTPDEKRINAQLLSQRNRSLKSPNVHVSANRLVVNNLPFKAELKAHFTTTGTMPGQKPAKVVQVKIMQDPKTKRSRGFGFVQFEDTENAKQALKKTNGQMFNDNRIFTSFTLDDARMKLQAEKLAEKRRDEARKKIKTTTEYKDKMKEKRFKRKMKKLERDLQDAEKAPTKTNGKSNKVTSS